MPAWDTLEMFARAQVQDDVTALLGALLEERARTVGRTIVDDDHLFIDRRRLDAIDQLKDRLALVEAGNNN
jgi:hypothetical protein